MRFNAFNFAGMKKSTIWVLGIVMGLSFLSLLYLQVSYIEEMVKMRKGNLMSLFSAAWSRRVGILSWWKLKSILRMMRLLRKSSTAVQGAVRREEGGRKW